MVLALVPFYSYFLKMALKMKLKLVEPKIENSASKQDVENVNATTKEIILFSSVIPDFA